MKFTITHFEICEVDGIAHVKSTVIVDGNEAVNCIPLSKYNKDDVVFLQGVEQFIRSKVGEIK